MKNIKIIFVLLFSANIMFFTACGNISEKNDNHLIDQNNRAFMQVEAEVIDPFYDPNPSIDKCWAEAGDSCCYANHGKCTTMMGRVACSEIASDGTITPGEEASGDDCAALAAEYANIE